MTISWSALSTYSSGPSEYAQNNSTNPGRLRVTGSTPNIGKGNLEVRGITETGGTRAFICGTDTIEVSTGQQNFTCSNGFSPKQVLYQRIYHKNGSSMTYRNEKTGTMTYHPNHGHYHVDDWTTMTLRLQDPNEPLPTRWPIVATGAKIGFCLMDYYNCWSSSANGHCRTEQGRSTPATGSVLNSTTQFPNNGLGQGYGCGADFQGISTGRTDVYDESLQGMWINLMPNLCNGSYWIVAEVDPTNVFREERDDNNWAAIPFNIALQRSAGSGGSGWIRSDKAPVITPGGTVTLTATPGASYAWSTGATSRSITVSQAGNYSCTISAPCGTLVSTSVEVTALAAPSAPTGTGATVTGPSTAQLSSTGAEPHWYDQATGGADLGTGATFTTPTLTTTTTFWVADRQKVQATSTTAGKTYVPSHGSNYNGRQWLLFDAYKPFILRSVEVYSNAVGLRHFALVDNVGNLVAEKFVELGTGQQVVDLGFRVPTGSQFKIGAYDSGATSTGGTGTTVQIVFQDMHRSTTGVTYPYALGTVGSITGSTEGASIYHFLYNWQVETEEAIAESARVPVVANVVNGVVVDARAMLQGPFDTNTGLMHDSLRVANLIPLSEPFTGLGFTHVGGGGGETLPASRLTVTGNDAVVDWVLVELRSESNPATILATQSAILTRSGEITSTTGSDLRFGVVNEDYYVAVRHRNHLAAMTSAPIGLSASATAVDFSSPSTATYGTEACKTVGGVQLLWAGDAVRDGRVMYTGSTNDRDRILTVIGGIIPTNVTSGYLKEDVNMDGRVKYSGARNDRDIVLSTIGGIIPTLIRLQQLP